MKKLLKTLAISERNHALKIEKEIQCEGSETSPDMSQIENLLHLAEYHRQQAIKYENEAMAIK